MTNLDRDLDGMDDQILLGLATQVNAQDVVLSAAGLDHHAAVFVSDLLEEQDHKMQAALPPGSLEEMAEAEDHGP